MKIKKKVQNTVISFLEKRYPGVREVVELLDKVRERVEKQYVEGVSEVDAKRSLSSQTKVMISKEDENQEEMIFKPEDKKWRPVLMTLGLMYKLQKVSDDHWYDDKQVFLQDEQKKTQVVELLARYWWYIMDLAKCLRGGSNKELYDNVAKGLKVESESVEYVFTKDAENAVVEDHCPDIAVVVHHESQEVVLTVCGTKMFPVPSVADILMDLYCDNVPFHQGRAHKGMALACSNILHRTLDIISSALSKHTGYKLVILGYSLGAGVAQLLCIELTQGKSSSVLPGGVQVLCVTYGAPPVYLHSSPGFTLPNLISVYNHNDGLASLSLHTVTKLFLQIRAINRLGLGRRRILRLLRKKIGRSESVQTEESSVTSSIRVHVTSEEEREREWGDISSAVNVVQETGFHSLSHIAELTYLIKRVDSAGQPGQDHVVRVLRGQEADPLASELRLRGGMFNDHMPWGYASLFKDCGDHSMTLSIDTVSALITYL